MEIEERLEKLKNAYAAGKVSKEIYEENLAKLEAERKALQSDDGMDDLLADILEAEIALDQNVEKDLGLDTSSSEASGTEDDDDLLMDDLFDSLVLKEEEVDCPLCGTSLPLGTQTCSNCDAKMSETGELIEEVSFESLAESIEDGLAELEDMAEDFALDDDLEEGLDELEEIIEEPAPSPAQPTPKVVPAVKRPAVKPVAKPVPKKAIEEPEIDEKTDIAPGDITEEEVAKVSMVGMRMVDLIIIGTLGGLIAVFIIFKLYYLSNFNALNMALFFGVAIAGMLVSFLVFRISSSAVAEGDRLFKAGKYEEALAHYEKAIKLSSKPATAWTAKGVALKRLGDFGGALRCHNTAIKLNPRNEIAWCNKGDLMFRLNKYDAALECYDNALDLNQKYAIAWNNKGTTLARMGRYKEANECQDKATRLKPKYAAAWVNKGEILAKLGKRQEAIACYKRAKQLVVA